MGAFSQGPFGPLNAGHFIWLQTRIAQRSWYPALLYRPVLEREQRHTRHYVALCESCCSQNPRLKKSMSYIVIKTIKGRRYQYLQTSWREGRHVRTRSVCLGPLDGPGRPGARKRAAGGLVGFFKAQHLSPEERVWAAVERQVADAEKYQREKFGETAAERAQRERQEHLQKLHDLYGLKLGPSNPTPLDKTTNFSTPAKDATDCKTNAAKNAGENANE